MGLDFLGGPYRAPETFKEGGVGNNNKDDIEKVLQEDVKYSNNNYKAKLDARFQEVLNLIKSNKDLSYADFKYKILDGDLVDESLSENNYKIINMINVDTVEGIYVLYYCALNFDDEYEERNYKLILENIDTLLNTHIACESVLLSLLFIWIRSHVRLVKMGYITMNYEKIVEFSNRIINSNQNNINRSYEGANRINLKDGASVYLWETHIKQGNKDEAYKVAKDIATRNLDELSSGCGAKLISLGEDNNFCDYLMK